MHFRVSALNKPGVEKHPYLPEDGAIFCQDPGVSRDPLDIGLAAHEEDDVTSGLALDQGVPARKRREIASSLTDILILLE